MYVLSKWFLAFGLFIFFYCLVVASALAFPWSLIFIAAGALRLMKRKGVFTAHGTSRWSNEPELEKAKMIGAKKGLMLGRTEPERNWGRAIWRVITKWPAKESCNGFLKLFRKNEGEIVRLSQAVHTAVFAPTRVGKGVSCVIPFLLTCEESCVVIDFKGELAALTAERRRRMGHEIVILDPYKLVTS